MWKTVVRASDFTKISRTLGQSTLQEGLRQHNLQDAVFAREIGGEWLASDFIKSKVRLVARPEVNGIVFSTPINDEVLLVGRPDEIISDISGLYLCENKPTPYPLEGYRNQLLSYCLLIKRNFEKELEESQKQVYGLLKKTDTQEIFWRVTFNDYWEKEIKKKIQELVISQKSSGGVKTAQL